MNGNGLILLVRITLNVLLHVAEHDGYLENLCVWVEGEFLQ